ncbi:MAG: hypothetical protein IKT52_12470 [Oscillospiraceae bacterium]|nr:hypothetical protein [Oscillospiraceae bacterium]
MKQMMINDGNHDVAEVRGKLKKGNGQLIQDYSNASDLNRFFGALPKEETAKFASIAFEKLKTHHQQILKDSLAPNKSLQDELNLLQQLRNDETHFAIHQILNSAYWQAMYLLPQTRKTINFLLGRLMVFCLLGRLPNPYGSQILCELRTVRCLGVMHFCSIRNSEVMLI